jgi:arylsulfatase A-like enzyme
VDLVPTLLALTGASPDTLNKVGEGLAGRDFSPLMSNPKAADATSLRPGALFCYDMLTFQDAKWATQFDVYMDDKKIPLAGKLVELQKHDPDFSNRCSIRSVFDGRYRFSRYFSPVGFNTPTTFESLLANNDLELYDLQSDPDETVNLAADPKANGDLILAMNAKLNGRIAAEVGRDDGSFLPIRNGKWHFPPASERR